MLTISEMMNKSPLSPDEDKLLFYSAAALSVLTMVSTVLWKAYKMLSIMDLQKSSPLLSWSNRGKPTAADRREAHGRRNQNKWDTRLHNFNIFENLQFFKQISSKNFT